MKLFLEKGMWSDDFYIECKKVCRELNLGYREISFVEIFNNIPSDKQIKMENCLEEMKEDFVFPYGCINFINYVKPKVEGVFWNSNLNVHKYLTYWQKYMINNNGYMITFGLLKSNKDKLFEKTNEVFIRPDSNNKVFSGKIYRKETFDVDIKMMGYSFEVDFIDDSELVWVFPRISIKQEYRMAIIDRKIVASSLYNENGLGLEKEGCPIEITDFANQVLLDKWQPDEIYSLDIGVTENNQIGVMEVGCLNCSGWYSMNIESILNGLKDWEIKYNEQNR